MKVLLLLDEIPDKFCIYSLTVNADEYRVLRKAHGNYLNMGDLPKKTEDYILRIMAACAPAEQKADYEAPSAWRAKNWNKHLVDANKPVVLTDCTLIRTGMFL